jgi:rsbT co-antagonist protein RsbR
MPAGRTVVDILRTNQKAILEEWLALQVQDAGARPDLISDDQLRRQSDDLLSAMSKAIQASGFENTDGPGWDDAREVLQRVAAERARQGFSPRETAMFVMSLKQPLFQRLRKRLDADQLADEIWAVSTAFDHLALYTTEAFQKTREEVISRQRMEMLELSTPVVMLWKGVLALPLIGTLDSERTQGVMENLLGRIVSSGSTIAILDITGVPTVDTLVAQHLLKTVAAARLMGADCIISGVRPQIAQTIIHLGIDLTNVTTKATLADAFAVALDRLGLTIGPQPARFARPTTAG